MCSCLAIFGKNDFLLFVAYSASVERWLVRDLVSALRSLPCVDVIILTLTLPFVTSFGAAMFTSRLIYSTKICRSALLGYACTVWVHVWCAKCGVCLFLAFSVVLVGHKLKEQCYQHVCIPTPQKIVHVACTTPNE